MEVYFDDAFTTIRSATLGKSEIGSDRIRKQQRSSKDRHARLSRYRNRGGEARRQGVYSQPLDRTKGQRHLDPRLDPSNILKSHLVSGEEIRIGQPGSRLCRDFRLSGTVHLSRSLGHSLGHALRGGTWVPGIWALTDRGLRYVSKRSWFGWHGGQQFDVNIPLTAIVDLERERVLRGLRYKIIYVGGSTRMRVWGPNADRFIGSLKIATGRP
jgi:hypothetical protein